MIKTMVILDEELNGKQMFQFTVDREFHVGDIIEHEKLHGKHEVKFVDIATVQVLAIN